MVNFKWDQKRAIEIAKADSERNALTRVVLAMLKDGFALDEIVKITSLSLNDVREIAKRNYFAFE